MAGSYLIYPNTTTTTPLAVSVAPASDTLEVGASTTLTATPTGGTAPYVNGQWKSSTSPTGPFNNIIGETGLTLDINGIAAPVTDPIVVEVFSVYNSTGNTASTVAVTAGTIQVSDLLIFSTTADGPSSANAVKTFVDPTGAAPIAGSTNQGSGFAPAQTWWSKVAAAADASATDFTFGADNANQQASFVYVIRNASAATFSDSQLDNTFGQSTVSLASAAMPAGSVYLSMIGIQGNTQTPTAPTSHTLEADESPGFHSGAAASRVFTTAASTGAVTWSLSGNTALSASSVIVN